jgi:hypothetical protein
MGALHQLRHRTRKSWSKISAPTGPRATNGPHGQLQIDVLFTSPEATVEALERTGNLLRGLNARINLIALMTVPYVLALNNPPVSVAFTEQQLLEVAGQSPVDTTAYLYICRCPFETLTFVLKPGSVLIIGNRKKWWPTWERKLARKLESAGFQALLLELS